MSETYFQYGSERCRVVSLKPFLGLSLSDGIFMDPAVMDESNAKTCRWVGLGIGKGITDPVSGITVFSIPNKIQSGLHYSLVEGFPDIDPFPLCYSEDHVKGFGNFIRWAYFADPKRKQDFLGVDFSIVLRPTSGVANSMIKVWEVVRTVARQGMPLDVEVVLVNHKMCEWEGVTKMRLDAGLITIGDWIFWADSILCKDSVFCPRCGLKTLYNNPNFCYRCGCRPELFYN